MGSALSVFSRISMMLTLVIGRGWQVFSKKRQLFAAFLFFFAALGFYL